MKRYKIEIEPRAQADVMEIISYISNELKARRTAQQLSNRLWAAVDSLSELPNRNPLVENANFADLGVRFLREGNYLIFYCVSEDTSTVHIITIMYARRDWKNHIREKIDRQ